MSPASNLVCKLGGHVSCLWELHYIHNRVNILPGQHLKVYQENYCINFPDNKLFVFLAMYVKVCNFKFNFLFPTLFFLSHLAF